MMRRILMLVAVFAVFSVNLAEGGEQGFRGIEVVYTLNGQVVVKRFDIDVSLGKIVRIPVQDMRGRIVWKRFLVGGSKVVSVSAYTSHRRQTDRSPCIPAAGRPHRRAKAFNLCEHGREDVIAANFADFWTKMLGPSHEDPRYLRVYTVVDRMNRRYEDNVDIWMKSIRDARQFGRVNDVTFLYLIPVD
jgi:3D (Asp-Asp-Asp) domain-containing protein